MSLDSSLEIEFALNRGRLQAGLSDMDRAVQVVMCSKIC